MWVTDTPESIPKRLNFPRRSFVYRWVIHTNLGYGTRLDEWISKMCTHEWINKMHINMGKFYSAAKTNEITVFAGKWMELGILC